jgi:hypothetical protein
LTWRWLVFLNNEGGTETWIPIKQQTMRRFPRNVSWSFSRRPALMRCRTIHLNKGNDARTVGHPASI